MALSLRDHLGTVRARVGVARNQYKINPGLYCVGEASATSPVLVTANYKLSFDALRRELAGIDAWILVADTRGINIWCAAGKGTFCAEEIALQVQRAGLEKIVSHRELILPQFGATGVAARQLRKLCGFKGIFGPLRAEDILRFLDNGKKANEPMRTVTFSLGERLVLVPVEIALIWKPFAFILLALFVLSGIGPDVFSVQASLARGANAAWATVLAILAGALAAPALLPWIPGRQFWFKGALVGAIAGLIYLAAMSGGTGITEQLGLWLWIVAAASYMAMNFTGATPYTSLSGVEKEMRRGLPVQCAAAAAALVLWIAAPFIN
ncbi:MAG: mercury methylation corrinoid protein HgcA [Desulfobulbaceae bacterium]|nr:mercury methylation corrinoid protein HgcA [Desulfobulbaceae bacterium]